jgi:hypothetical protein
MPGIKIIIQSFDVLSRSNEEFAPFIAFHLFQSWIRNRPQISKRKEVTARVKRALG